MGDEAEKTYKELSELFKAKTLEQWMDHFKDVDCCISPVLSLSETIKNEQVVARNTVVTNEHPEEGDVIQFSLPLKFSSFEFEIKKPAPLHGEDTLDILTDLGYSAKEIEELKDNLVI